MFFVTWPRYLLEFIFSAKIRNLADNIKNVFFPLGILAFVFGGYLFVAVFMVNVNIVYIMYIMYKSKMDRRLSDIKQGWYIN